MLGCLCALTIDEFLSGNIALCIPRQKEESSAFASVGRYERGGTAPSEDTVVLTCGDLTSGGIWDVATRRFLESPDSGMLNSSRGLQVAFEMDRLQQVGECCSRGVFW